jgi:hypothetical protein
LRDFEKQKGDFASFVSEKKQNKRKTTFKHKKFVSNLQIFSVPQSKSFFAGVKSFAEKSISDKTADKMIATCSPRRKM